MFRLRTSTLRVINLNLKVELHVFLFLNSSFMVDNQPVRIHSIIEIILVVPDRVISTFQGSPDKIRKPMQCHMDRCNTEIDILRCLKADCVQ